MNKVICLIDNILSDEQNILIVFLFFSLCLFLMGFIYLLCLKPNSKEIKKVIVKYRVGDYSIPYHVAERYCTWNNMKVFFFCLDYLLTLLSITASLMVVLYASNYKSNNTYIIFLTLLSTCFTVASIHSKPGNVSVQMQHIWKELDLCIIQVIHNNDLSSNKKDLIIINRILEIEKSSKIKYLK